MILSNLLVVAVLVHVLWVWSVIRRDASVIDPWWSIGSLLVAVNSVRLTGMTPGKALLLGVVAIWALRLWGYLLIRSVGKPEDPRYQAFRQQFGPERYWWFSYFQVFLLQGSLVLVVSAPLAVAAAASAPDPIVLLDWVGAGIALAGLTIEAVADAQLAAWRKRPDRGAVFDEGLWRASRHPNYFGECLVAWGLWLFALDQPYGWLVIFGPLVTTFLLLRVSGVAMLDRHMARSKPEYRAYMENTPAFVPDLRRLFSR